MPLFASEIEAGLYTLSIANDKGWEVRTDRNVSMAIKDGGAKIITVVVSHEGKTLEQNTTEFVAGATLKAKLLSKEKVKQGTRDAYKIITTRKNEAGEDVGMCALVIDYGKDAILITKTSIIADVDKDEEMNAIIATLKPKPEPPLVP